MDTLFVAWQDAGTREWIPVGMLWRQRDRFKFAYTRGAKRALSFQPFGPMTDFEAVYESPVLFPVFANRVISKSRPEYKDYLRWLGLEDVNSDPLTVLGMTGGLRGTDSIELFPRPERAPDGLYSVSFFARGLRHLHKSALETIAEIKPGSGLKIIRDCQNDFDRYALCLSTLPPTRQLVGFCPKYLAQDISGFLDKSSLSVEVRVKAVNNDAPLDMRLLCTVTAPWHEGYDPFAGHGDFEMLAKEGVAA